jgi:hypothetical protein
MHDPVCAFGDFDYLTLCLPAHARITPKYIRFNDLLVRTRSSHANPRAPRLAKATHPTFNAHRAEAPDKAASFKSLYLNRPHAALPQQAFYRGRSRYNTKTSSTCRKQFVLMDAEASGHPKSSHRRQ